MLKQEIREVPASATAQFAHLRLPPGLRLDAQEAIAIASSSAQRGIVFVNAAFARLTGFDAQFWIGRPGDLLQAEGPLRMESLLWLDTAADGSEVHWIARMHRRDGTPFCAEAHLHRIAAGKEGNGHVVLVVADVTNRVADRKSRAAAPPCNGQPVPA